MSKRIRQTSQRQPNYIRAWREHQGLTQDQLAEKLDMSKAQLSRVENLHQGYTQDLLEAIAEILATDVISLLSEPPEGESLWSVWRSASPDQRTLIREFALMLTRRKSAK
jgi:transcriptional regulator with XRE-family HTH domain